MQPCQQLLRINAQINSVFEESSTMFKSWWCVCVSVSSPASVLSQQRSPSSRPPADGCNNLDWCAGVLCSNTDGALWGGGGDGDTVKRRVVKRCSNLSLTQRRSTPECTWSGNYQHSAYKFPQREKQCIPNESASIYLPDCPHTLVSLHPNRRPRWREIKKSRFSTGRQFLCRRPQTFLHVRLQMTKGRRSSSAGSDRSGRDPTPLSVSPEDSPVFVKEQGGRGEVHQLLMSIHE